MQEVPGRRALLRVRVPERHGHGLDRLAALDHRNRVRTGTRAECCRLAGGAGRLAEGALVLPAPVPGTWPLGHYGTVRSSGCERVREGVGRHGNLRGMKHVRLEETLYRGLTILEEECDAAITASSRERMLDLRSRS